MIVHSRAILQGVSNPQPPKPVPEVLAENRAEILPVILEEMLRQRKDQDERLEYQRRVAWLFFSVFLPGAGLATFWMLRLEGEFNPYWTGAAAVSFVLGVIATLKVMETQKWQSGPKIQNLLARPLDEGWELEKFQYALVISHLREFRANEGRVRRVRRWSSRMVGFFLSSVLFLGIAVATYNAEMQTPEQPGRDDTALALPEQAPEPAEQAPLYDVEPFEPTFVEKGDNSYYEPPFD